MKHLLKILLIILIIIFVGLIAFLIFNDVFKKGTALPLDDSAREEIDRLFNNTENDSEVISEDAVCVTKSRTDYCICGSDAYNCADFSTQAEAQVAFDVCGPEDVHVLDNDGDGVVCEGLP